MDVWQKRCNGSPTYLHHGAMQIVQVIEKHRLLEHGYKSNSGKNILQIQQDKSTWRFETVHRIQSKHQRCSTIRLSKRRNNQSSSKKTAAGNIFYTKVCQRDQPRRESNSHPWILFMLETLERFIQKLMRPVQLG